MSNTENSDEFFDQTTSENWDDNDAIRSEEMQKAVLSVFNSVYGEGTVITAEQAEAILHLCGQGGDFTSELNDGTDINSERVSTLIFLYGDYSEGPLAVAKANASTLQSIAYLEDLADEQMKSNGPARIVMGNPASMTHHIGLELDNNPQSAPSGDIKLSIGVRLAGKESLSFLRQFCAPLSTLFNFYLSSEALPTTTQIEINELTKNTAEVAVSINFTENTVMADKITAALEKLACSVKNVHAYAKFAPLRQMTGIDSVAFELGFPIDLIPSVLEFVASLPSQLVTAASEDEDNESGFKESVMFSSEDELFRAIPGLKQLCDGNLQARVDLTGLIDKVKTSASTMSLDVTNFKSAIGTFAPLGLLFMPSSVQLDPNAAIESLRAIVQIQRLIIARDVKEILQLKVTARGGLTAALDFNGLLDLESIFTAIDDGIMLVHEAINATPGTEEFPNEEDF